MDCQRHFAVVAQTKMNARVAGAAIADTIGYETHLRALSASTDHFRAYGRSVTARAFKFQLQPVLHRAAIHPKFYRSVDGGDGDIDSSVIVEVGKYRAPVDPGDREIRTGHARYIDKLSAYIAQDAVWLRLVHIKPATGDEDVEDAIVVKVCEAATPSAPRPA